MLTYDLFEFCHLAFNFHISSSLNKHKKECYYRAAAVEKILWLNVGFTNIVSVRALKCRSDLEKEQVGMKEEHSKLLQYLHRRIAEKAICIHSCRIQSDAH
ncbi:hypothetical protein T4D_14033 [Trichinella pseudospiralis]|uniref:Uncharacterized protein n=1 Tax=Trichinella pseudospiralis TaxID=6337 RepID=A0A0V1FEC5_TRIPS|nr:hypothetical protein T4D_14033 [Trichinella pseudospiralis]